MTYHAGIGLGLASLVGRPEAPLDPHVRCDAPGCAAIAVGVDRTGFPRAWIRNGKAPPKWRMDRNMSVDGVLLRYDYCPEHKAHYSWGERC